MTDKSWVEDGRARERDGLDQMRVREQCHGMTAADTTEMVREINNQWR